MKADIDWNNVEVFINGKKVNGIKTVTVNPQLKLVREKGYYWTKIGQDWSVKYYDGECWPPPTDDFFPLKDEDFDFIDENPSEY